MPAVMPVHLSPSVRPVPTTEEPPRAELEALPVRVAKAALEVPKAIGRGAMGGVVVVGLPSVLVPPLAPFFLPWLPVAAAVGSMHGATNGFINALTYLTVGNDFRRL